MKVKNIINKNKYFDIQIQRSRQKFDYCKVSIKEVISFEKILKSIMVNVGPIICLGTRNGREIDLFRNVFFNNYIFSIIINALEIRRHGYRSIFPKVEGFFRSKLNSIDEKSVIGVEINPDAKSQDTWIGSFDEMPLEWSNKFSILYSNSFDQSQDPFRTAAEWKRVVRVGGVLIIGFTNTDPTESDPVGNLSYADIINLFGGELIYFSKIFNYNFIILQVKTK
jgi:hypothetical protein